MAKGKWGFLVSGLWALVHEDFLNSLSTGQCPRTPSVLQTHLFCPSETSQGGGEKRWSCHRFPVLAALRAAGLDQFFETNGSLNDGKIAATV